MIDRLECSTTEQVELAEMEMECCDEGRGQPRAVITIGGVEMVPGLRCAISPFQRGSQMVVGLSDEAAIVSLQSQARFKEDDGRAVAAGADRRHGTGQPPRRQERETVDQPCVEAGDPR